ncbi:MAG: phosphoheptose isomerase [Deltaproteobacteria bacterium GWC2_56_8]|nr:MAG: phosphoheptose isomerase [Deltaproteobacteria bacterium GWB2_55_19]OGP38036.1 MAG: phosphoheptose isomerase [Deltaproteobacteria bacterium GWC2_56_8]HAO92775.1 phosphoheptose isomerase [Deltaproteobacteria bacterium]
MEKIVEKSFKDSVKAKERFFTKKNMALVVEASEAIVSSFKSGGKLMLIGNGGSAADSQHIAAEFVNRFEIERPPLPALALTTDTSDLTSIGNDYSFDQVFSKQIRALGKENDVLLAISTSGNSANVLKGMEAAKAMKIKTIGLTGKNGGAMADKVDILLNVDTKTTARIQETHITICHIICELVDHMLFQKV